MTRRTGSSLMEVLVTIGILGIGLTSVITLFPFAAITMGHALKDGRTGSCAVCGDAYFRDYHRRHVVEVERDGGKVTEPYYFALDLGTGTGTGLPGEFPPVPPLPPTFTGPSYPVAIDPMGWTARNGRGDRTRLGDPTTATGVPRRSLNEITKNPAVEQLMALNLFSQRDGLSYNEDGNVVGGAGGAGMRELRYNWLFVVQRPVNSDRHTLTLKVVVFDKRTHMYAPPGSEAVYSGVVFTPGQTAITGLSSAAEIRKGTWIMDATVNIPTSSTTASAVQPIRHANFYRVTSVTEVGNTYTLELHTPVRRTDGLSLPYAGTVVVMPGVAEVFERPMLTGGAGP